MKLLPIFLGMLLTLLSWGAQSSLILMAQKNLGTWRYLFFYAAGFLFTAAVVGSIGCYCSTQPPITKYGATYGVLSGITGCLGGVGLALAFGFAAKIGNHVGSTWISPGIGGLLPIFYVLMAVLIIPRPKDGWTQIFSSGYLLGMLFVVVGVVLLTIYRIK